MVKQRCFKVYKSEKLMEITLSLPHQVGNPKGASLYSNFQHCTGLHHQVSQRSSLFLQGDEVSFVFKPTAWCPRNRTVI